MFFFKEKNIFLGVWVQPSFSVMLSKGDSFHDCLFVCLPGGRNLLKLGSTLKGKNLLLGEQIHFFER